MPRLEEPDVLLALLPEDALRLLDVRDRRDVHVRAEDRHPAGSSAGRNHVVSRQGGRAAKSLWAWWDAPVPEALKAFLLKRCLEGFRRRREVRLCEHLTRADVPCDAKQGIRDNRDIDSEIRKKSFI